MEKLLFDWDYRDEQDAMAFIFYNVKLKVEIGRFPVGTQFDHAYVSYENGVLELSRLGAMDSLGNQEIVEAHQFKLELKIV